MNATLRQSASSQVYADSLLDQVIDATTARPQPIAIRQAPKPLVKSITQPQKDYITHLRNEARKVNQVAVADKKVMNRQQASDYIRELKDAIARGKKYLADAAMKSAVKCGW